MYVLRINITFRPHKSELHMIDKYAISLMLYYIIVHFFISGCLCHTKLLPEATFSR